MTMRFVFSLMTVLVFLIAAGFVLTNMEARVSITIWETPFENVRLVYVIILAAIVGVVYTGVIAIVEGAAIRLTNKRLRRDIERLEGELNYLRTQRAAPRPEPDALDRVALTPPGERQDAPRSEAVPASAPVYSPDEDWVGDPGDDTDPAGRSV